MFMRSQTASRLVGHRLSGCLCAFVLSLAQVYPAFATCICLPDAAARPEAIVAEVVPACHADQSAVAPQLTAEAMYSKSCTPESHRAAGLSSETCCVSLALSFLGLSASLSRSVETRSSHDAAHVAYLGDSAKRVSPGVGNTRPPEVGEFNYKVPPRYLSNVSLLI